MAAVNQHFGTFLLAQVQVAQDLGELFLRCLRPIMLSVSSGFWCDGGHAPRFHELVVDRFPE